MERIGKIFVDGSQVDLYENSSQKSISLKISDITSISTRRSSSTGTILVPATANNKLIFGFSEDINSADLITQKEIPKVVIQSANGNNVFKGVIKVDSVTIDGKVSEYSLKAIGDNGEWKELLKDKKLKDFDWSSDNHTLNQVTINNSWTVSATRNYVYDLIDRGKFTGTLANINGSHVHIRDVYPAINVLATLTKFFNSIGYKISLSSLTGSFFSKLYFPFCNPVLKHPSTWKDDKNFRGVTSSTYGKNFLEGITGQTSKLIFDDDTTNTGFDTSNNYNLYGFAGIKEFKAPNTCKYKFHYELSYHIYGGAYGTINFKINKRKQGSLGLTEIHRYTTVWGASAPYNTQVTTDFLELEAGDFVSMTMEVDLTSGAGGGYIEFKPHIQWTRHNFFELIDMAGDFPVEPNQPVIISENLPDIKALDFIDGVKGLFNLMIMGNIDERTVYIEPEDDFYTGKVLDWSKKVDLSEPIEIDFIGDTYSKTLRYQYKIDDKDKYVAEINKANTVPYGSYDATVANKFAKEGIQNITNNLFSPTIMETPPAPLVGLKTVKIPRMWSESSQPAKKTDFGLRLLYYDGLKALPTTDKWGIQDETGLVYYKNSYPRFYSYGNKEGEYNLLFEDTEYASGLFETYYRNKHKIIDESRIYKPKVYLDDNDISMFDFRNIIYIELEGNGAYFRMQAVVNYDPDDTRSTKVELIKVVGTKAISVVGKKKKSTGQPLWTGGGITAANPNGSGASVIKIQDKTITIVDPDGTVHPNGGYKVWTRIGNAIHPVVMTSSENRIVEVIIKANEGVPSQVIIP